MDKISTAYATSYDDDDDDVFKTKPSFFMTSDTWSSKRLVNVLDLLKFG